MDKQWILLRGALSRKADPCSVLPRSEDLRASLQCERAVPPTAGAVLPLQRLAHHSPLLPECSLDGLQQKGPDLSGTGEWGRGEHTLYPQILANAPADFSTSAPQLEKLQEALSSTEEDPSEPLVQNYRVPQPLNQRTVFASFIQGDLQGSGEMGNWRTQRHELVRPREGGGCGERVPEHPWSGHQFQVWKQSSQMGQCSETPLTQAFLLCSGTTVYHR